jgi:molecular chaperone GrpE
VSSDERDDESNHEHGDSSVENDTRPELAGQERSVSTSHDAVAQRLDGLGATLERLQEDLRSANDRAALREQVIARLHEENERLRAGERHLLLRPVQADLQRLRNDLLRQAATLPAEYSGAKAADLLESFAVSVELALERCGIGVLRPESGVAFDPGRHRAVDTVPAASPDQDATIAEVVADGYLDTVLDRMVTPAAVRVRRWRTAAAAPMATPASLPLARPRTD